MAQTYNRRLHVYAVFTACCTFLLLVAGALVTSNDAGLSVPDWPLSYGSVTPPWVGGIRYEHSHRVVATLVGLLTIGLAIWLGRSELRRWVRRLGYFALATVVAQGILGGITVKFFLPIPVSVAHATLGQLFFGLVVSIAIFTARWWHSDVPQAEDPGSPRAGSLAAWSVAAVFLQLILGAAFRHKGFGIVPHLIGAAVVSVLVFWTAGVLRRRFEQVPALRGSVRLLHVLLGAQLLLGGAAWWSRVWSAEFPQPMPPMVILTVAHTVVGALVLASTLGAALICRRVLGPAQHAVVGAQSQQAAL